MRTCRTCRTAYVASRCWFLRLSRRSVQALPFAEDAVLLATTVPGYTPGMVVASTVRLSVPDGASATLLFRSGGMLRLRGPFEGTLEQQRAGTGETSIAMLADMFRMRGVDAAVIGGTRSVSPTRAVEAMDDVEVDPQRSGTYCVEPATTVWIGPSRR